MASSTQKFHLILDFDGTIIKNNTIPLLDYLRQDQIDVSYNSFLDPYLRDYTEHIRDYQPSQDKRITLQQEYDYLDSLFNTEKRSIERIESSGWLKGLKWDLEDKSQFDKAASRIRCSENLIWRAGFADLVKMVWKLDGNVDILSVNWSRNFMQALLRQEFGETVNVNKIGIYSNEVAPLGTGHFSRVHWETRDIFSNYWPVRSDQGNENSRGIWTAQDKALIMRAITTIPKAEDVIVIYVGDSKTDLRCINEANIGIRVVDHDNPSTEQTSLEEVLKRLGINQVPIGNLSLEPCNNEESHERVIYHAQDFNDIREALLGWKR